MKAKNIVAIASLGLLAVALTLWFRAARSRHRSEEMLSRLQTEGLELARKLSEAERQPPATQVTEAAPVLAAKLSAAESIATPASATISEEPSRPKQSRNDRMASDPGAQTLWLQRVRAKAALHYGEFFQRRNLSLSQSERFLENKLRFDELGLDLEIAVAPGDASDKIAAKTLRQRGKAEYEAAQQATLGTDHYQALLEYERTTWVRNVVVNSFAGGAALAGLPLTAEQGDRLLKAALAATGNDTATSGDSLVRRIDWEMLDLQAQQILTPEQFAFFRNAQPAIGYPSRWNYQIDAAAERAQKAEAEKSPAK